MKAASWQKSRDRILYLLKTGGPQTAATLASDLPISVIAVHQHLRNLADAGLVTYADHKGKVGRPARHWEVTRAAADRFPDFHRELSVHLVQGVREVCGEGALKDILSLLRKNMVDSARVHMPESDAPAWRRVEALAAVREGAGYMARMRRQADGSLILQQCHCPVLEAASCCAELCEVELEAFQELLGEDLEIERFEHMTSGDRHCSYRITTVACEV